jgi:hypothetical protein
VSGCLNLNESQNQYKKIEQRSTGVIMATLETSFTEQQEVLNAKTKLQNAHLNEGEVLRLGTC